LGRQSKLPSFLLALGVFLALALTLRFSCFPPASLAAAEQTWTTRAIDDYLKRPKAPDLVLLGSSLVLTPINLTDAKVLNKTLDGALHHESVTLGLLLKELTGKPVTTFNFAVPGEMPSDAYLIEKLLLKDNKQPKLVIYGVGPRDFMDNLLASPTATDPYQWLARLDSKPDPAFIKNDRSPGYYLTEAILPASTRTAISEMVSNSVTSSVSNLLAARNFSVLSNHTKHVLLPQYRSMSVEVGECLFKPVLENEKERFNNNLDEYKRRYGEIKWDTFCTQLNFMAKLLDVARSRHTQVLLVAMPVTSINKNLIAPYAWETYKNSLTVLAHEKGAAFLDFDNTSAFSDDDFGDTVHLNTRGAIRMIALLSNEVTKQEALTKALGLPYAKTKVATKSEAESL
jgi:hypothetical protein